MSVAGPSTKFNCSLKKWNHYILASESSNSSSEGSETAYSIQGKETDLARDTSDLSSDEYDTTLIEYDVQSDDDTDKDILKFTGSNGSSTDDEIIKTTVIEAIVPEGDFFFADSEDSRSTSSVDSELSKFDYWKCVRCHNKNNNPMFRYCEKCYQLRKDFFPPPPKHRKRKNRQRAKKQKQNKGSSSVVAAHTSVLHHVEGIGFHFRSNSLSNHIINKTQDGLSDSNTSNEDVIDGNLPNVNSGIGGLKRKRHSSGSDNLEAENKGEVRKRFRSFLIEDSSDLITELGDIKNSVDSFSQPVFSTLTDIELNPFSDQKYSKDDLDIESAGKIHSSGESVSSLSKSDSLTKMVDKAVGIDVKERSDLCITCLIEPKSGVFVHGRIAHICCCYKCSVKVWIKTKRCPICKCKVSNVLKAFVS